MYVLSKTYSIQIVSEYWKTNHIVTQSKIHFIVLADSQHHLEDLGGLGHRVELGSFVIIHLSITSD